jgi:phenol 2-monooxygenase (NADPH)
VQFHHHGYVSGDPRVAPSGLGPAGRPDEIPDAVDVLIVGTGPAGMLLAAQLAQFPEICTRVVERRPGRLEIGQADGIQARSVETFQAFGFAERIIAEAYRITHTCFWIPDRNAPERIVRGSITEDDPTQISEFPHLIVNQARVLDYFAEAMRNGPARITPDYGVEFAGLEVAADAPGELDGGHPVTVTLRQGGETRRVAARYVVGCDGARSRVRDAIGLGLAGDQSFHAWAVMDVLAVTDFPDFRTKCMIQSRAGNILLIPREGGYLVRLYVDLGELSDDDHGAIRATTLEAAIDRANAIMHPYTLDVRDTAWYSVYEVAHRITDRFDDVAPGETRTPRVFIAGDACHTHSAKAGQGMNVSMQDTFNLGWKLAHVLRGLAPGSLLSTYSAERQVVAQQLIDFDREWSSLMARRPEEFEDPAELGEFYVRTIEFPAGFLTTYAPSMIVGEATHQALAIGFPIGRRFKSAPVVRVADGNPVQLGHHARADGRWRLYVFGGRAGAGEELTAWSDWLLESPESPVVAHTPPGSDVDSLFDVKLVLAEAYPATPVIEVPEAFRPRSGPLGLMDYEKVYACGPGPDIHELRGIDRDAGAIVVVRPDQYVATVLPAGARRELAAFFAGALLPQRRLARTGG